MPEIHPPAPMQPDELMRAQARLGLTSEEMGKIIGASRGTVTKTSNDSGEQACDYCGHTAPIEEE